MQIKQMFFKSIRKVSAFLMLWAPCSFVFKAHFWACKKLDRQQVTKAVVL
jgi:hypothetical protein